jgi:DNA-directed RNA polymerase specialized sigma24 family protein
VSDHLLAQIAAGDSRAFGLWVAGCEHSLRVSLRKYAASVDTEAVLQEALLRVWQVAPKFKPDGRPDALLRFASVTARNVALSEIRRLGTQPPAEETPDVAVLATSPDPLLRAAVRDCRDKLPGQPRLALDQRLESAGGDDDHVLAERVGMKLNTFLQNFTRARKLLAECLQKRGIDLQTEMRA